MNRQDLIAELRKETGITKQEAVQVVELFFGKMADALADEDRVEIRGFCSFYLKEYESYMGRNPKTGEKVEVPPKRLPFFKPGKELEERVNRNGNRKRRRMK